MQCIVFTNLYHLMHLLMFADLSFDATCQAYGEYFIKYCLDIGYASMLRALGQNTRAFIQNLDTVHTLLAVSYKNIVPPIFRSAYKKNPSVMIYFIQNLFNVHTLPAVL